MTTVIIYMQFPFFYTGELTQKMSASSEQHFFV